MAADALLLVHNFLGFGLPPYVVAQDDTSSALFTTAFSYEGSSLSAEAVMANLGQSSARP